MSQLAADLRNRVLRNAASFLCPSRTRRTENSAPEAAAGCPVLSKPSLIVQSVFGSNDPAGPRDKAVPSAHSTLEHHLRSKWPREEMMEPPIHAMYRWWGGCTALTWPGRGAWSGLGLDEPSP